MLITYDQAIGLINFVSGALTRQEITGLEYVPKEGPVIFASNHVASAEILLIPAKLERKVHFLAKKELFEGGTWFKDYLRDQFTKWEAFPVDRDGMKPSQYKKCNAAIKNNEALFVFPEGTRSKDGKIGEFKDGLALIVEKMYDKKIDIPVVPIGVSGTRELQSPLVLIPKLKKYSMHIGRPLYYRNYASDDKEESKRKFTEALKEKIIYLIDKKEYEGFLMGSSDCCCGKE